MRSFSAGRTFLAFVTLLGINYSSLMAQTNPEFLVYRKMIADTDKTAGNQAELVDFFSSPVFVAIYAQPESYVDDTLWLLGQKDVSEQQKLIAVYGLHNLSLDAYLTYLNALLELAKAGKITQNIFKHGAFPSVEWAPTFYENHTNAKVLAFVKSAKALAKSKGWNIPAIDGVLNGQAAKAVKFARDAGEIPVVKK